MDPAETARLIAELRALVDRGPGKDEPGLKRAQEIVRKFQWNDSSSGIVREKAGSAAAFFAIWLSVRKWQQYGANGERAKAILRQEIRALERALQR